ncbi:MAG: ferredoxin, partial [Planctomycetota bacterium]
MAESTIQDTVTQAESFYVEPELCIACDACCQDFPEVFYMGDDEKAHAVDGHKWDLYNARTVVEVCPTSAIIYSGELPEAEDAAKLEEVPGWELVWAQTRGLEEDQVERNRRYGRDFTVEHEEGYVLVNMNLPLRVPPVRDRFRYGLSDEMPRYRAFHQMQGGSLVIYGWLTDPKIRSLTHTSSSFPAQFNTALELNIDVVGEAMRYDAHGSYQIVLFTDPAVRDRWQWDAHFITDKCTA